MGLYKYIVNQKTYIGLSTDDKPLTADTGAILYEINANTGEQKTYKTIDGSNWYIIDSSITETNISNVLTSSIGGNGGILISNTTATIPETGKIFIAIQAITDITFTNLTGNLSGTLTGITFPAGTIIYGKYTSITLASGTIIAYEGV